MAVMYVYILFLHVSGWRYPITCSACPCFGHRGSRSTAAQWQGELANAANFANQCRDLFTNDQVHGGAASNFGLPLHATADCW